MSDDTEGKGDDRSSELAQLRAWYEYNSYVRKKYLETLEKLPTEELLRDRGASHPSLLDILLHTVDAYRAWFVYRWEGKGWDSDQRTAGRVRSIPEARKEVSTTDSYVLALVRKLRPEDLDKTIQFPDSGRVFRDTLGDVLWHMVEEELQHRGELNALLWQANIEPPVTDWLAWKFETGQPGPSIVSDRSSHGDGLVRL